MTDWASPAALLRRSSEPTYGGFVSIPITTTTFTGTPRTELQRLADVAARTAIVAVPQDVNTNTIANRTTRRAIAAYPLVTVRGWFGADVSAGAAVVRIRNHGRACPVADHSAIDAVVNARSLNASAVLIRTSLVTPGAALSAVFHVIGQISAVVAATALAVGAAVVSAGPAVGV